MRPAARLLARVGQSKFLEVGTPTGLTGLLTSQAPRQQLLALYSATLDRLQRLPESSVYRQSTEALTKRRLQLVEKTIPEGHQEWKQQESDGIRRLKNVILESTRLSSAAADHNTNASDDVVPTFEALRTDNVPQGSQAENTIKDENPEHILREIIAEKRWLTEENIIEELGSHPLTAEQISELESNIGAGLIEEVISVAEGELITADTISKHEAWNELEAQAPEGQWSYFERQTHEHKPS